MRELISWTLSAAFLAASLATAPTALGAAQVCQADCSADEVRISFAQDQPQRQNNADYSGRLRVYMVEPVSRWLDYYGESFDFGFLDFAIDVPLMLSDPLYYDTTVVWDAAAAGYADITEDNIMAIAALSNSEPHQAYSDPPDNLYPFTAYYVDAAAGAAAGESGHNEVAPGFTHTVFLEAGEVTTCPWSSRLMLDLIYDSGLYPFLYATLVADSNQVAEDRLWLHYNMHFWPVVFFDGGYEVLLGYIQEPEPWITKLEACGARVVPEMKLAVTTTWLAKGNVRVRVQINWICGDADGNGIVNVSDVVYLITYIFGGGPKPEPLLAGDVDCNEIVNVSDAVYLISYIFGGGPEPCAGCP